MKIYNVIVVKDEDIIQKARKLVVEVHFIFYNHEDVFDNLLDQTMVGV